jgi:hypothetical protein
MYNIQCSQNGLLLHLQRGWRGHEPESGITICHQHSTIGCGDAIMLQWRHPIPMCRIASYLEHPISIRSSAGTLPWPELAVVLMSLLPISVATAFCCGQNDGAWLILSRHGISLMLNHRNVAQVRSSRACIPLHLAI